MNNANVVYQEGYFKIIKNINGYSLYENDELVIQDKRLYKLMSKLRRRLNLEAAIKIANSEI